MTVGCSVAISLILVLYLCTIPYKRNFRKKLNIRQHKLLMLYGISMFLVDRIPKKIMNKNSTVSSAMKKLSVKEKVQKEKYLYLVEKTSVSLIVILLSLIIGLIMDISQSKKENYITNLKRDSKNITTYEFYAENEQGQQESVVVDVQSRQLTEEQIRQRLEDAEEELVENVLGSNKDTEYVDKPLNLVTAIGENINVSWYISDSSVIDYDGDIKNNISEQGTIVNLTATLTLNYMSEEYTFSVNVFPKSGSDSVQEQIQKYVDENDNYKESVKLPEEINGASFTYYNDISDYGKGIVFIGFLAAVSIFILKDQDLKKEITKRDNQMLADYPEIVSKILLYYGAGLSLKSSIERIVTEYKTEKQNNKKLFRYAYEELEMSLTKINSGISEIEAINDYGNRCGLHCYIKLSGIIQQNLKRGAREVTFALKSEISNAMMERKNTALKTGGEISTKLLGPMIVMLVVSIAIIMVPAILSINV